MLSVLLIEQRGAANLEDAFIAYMEDPIRDAAAGANQPADAPVAAAQPAPPATAASVAPGRASRWTLPLTRMLAYARNETMQILRDPVRLTFTFLGSAVLMLVCGFGITTDVEHIRYATFDQDQSPASRAYLEQSRRIGTLLHKGAAGALRRRRARSAEVGRRVAGPRNSTQLRPEPAQGRREEVVGFLEK